MSGPSPSSTLSVLVVSHGSTVWGAQLRLLDVAPQLRPRGVELTMAAPEGPLADAWRRTGLPFVPLQLPEHRGLRDEATGARPSPPQLAREVAVQVESARRLVPLVRRHHVTHSFKLAAHVETALAGRMARRPVVLELVDIVAPGLGRRVLQGAARLAAVTVANSEATAAALGPVRDRAEVIHPGVDLQRFSPGPADPAVRAELGGIPGVPLVGIIGRIDPEKGVDVLATAMATAAGPAGDARLVVVGDAGTGPQSYADEVRRRATEQLGDRVRFAGRRSDMPEVVRSLDVLVNGSQAEPFGRSVLEAQASGVAVIGTRSGGIPEFVQDGVTGLLVPPGDPASLAAALDRLLADDELRAHLAAAGREQAERRFDITHRFDRLAELYRSLTSTSSR